MACTVLTGFHGSGRTMLLKRILTGNHRLLIAAHRDGRVRAHRLPSRTSL